MAVDVQAAPIFRAGIPQALFVFKFSPGSTWDVAPDGKRFLIEQSVAAPEGVRKMHAVVNWFEELSRLVPTKPN